MAAPNLTFTVTNIALYQTGVPGADQYVTVTFSQQQDSASPRPGGTNSLTLTLTQEEASAYEVGSKYTLDLTAAE